MVFSAIGMGCCMAIMTGTVSHIQNKACQVVAAMMIFLFSFFFPTGEIEGSASRYV